MYWLVVPVDSDPVSFFFVFFFPSAINSDDRVRSSLKWSRRSWPSSRGRQRTPKARCRVGCCETRPHDAFPRKEGRLEECAQESVLKNSTCAMLYLRVLSFSCAFFQTTASCAETEDCGLLLSFQFVDVVLLCG